MSSRPKSDEIKVYNFVLMNHYGDAFENTQAKCKLVALDEP